MSSTNFILGICVILLLGLSYILYQTIPNGDSSLESISVDTVLNRTNDVVEVSNLTPIISQHSGGFDTLQLGDRCRLVQGSLIKIGEVSNLVVVKFETTQPFQFTMCPSGSKIILPKKEFNDWENKQKTREALIQILNTK